VVHWDRLTRQSVEDQDIVVGLNSEIRRLYNRIENVSVYELLVPAGSPTSTALDIQRLSDLPIPFSIADITLENVVGSVAFLWPAMIINHPEDSYGKTRGLRRYIIKGVERL